MIARSNFFYVEIVAKARNGPMSPASRVIGSVTYIANLFISNHITHNTTT